MTSRVAIPVDGNTRLFTVPFPFIHQSHVGIYLNRVLQMPFTDFVWATSSSIEFLKNPQGTLEFIRSTPDVGLTVFHDGSVLNERDLNAAVQQAMYCIEELKDQYDGLVSGALDKVAGVGGVTSDPQSVLDALTQSILNSSLLADLQARIADIDLNARTITAQEIRVDTLDDTIRALANIDGTPLATFIIDEKNQRIAGDTAIAEEVHLIGAKSPDGLSFIFDTNTAKVSPTETLAHHLSAMVAETDAAKAAIAAESTARVAGDYASSTRLDAVEAKASTNAASIASEATARAGADNALSTRIDTVTATASGNTAAIASESTARANADTALTTQYNQLVTRVGAAEGLIQSESTARASADSAATARMDGMQSSINGNAAAIVTEQTTRANADSALSSSISTLQTTVNGNTASIATIQTVQNGLTAQYMVKLDVNGYVSGFGQYNSGSSAQFIVLADKFAVVTPGRSAQVPFVVGSVGGVSTVGVNGQLIVDGTIYARSLSVNQLSAISGDMGTLNAGKVSLTGNGMTLILEGGATYPMWFGTGSVADPNNATFFLKNDGSMYLKGSLRSSNMDMKSAAIATGGGRMAPITIYDSANASSSGGANLACYLGELISPTYGTGYMRSRVSSNVVDVFLEADASGFVVEGGAISLYFDVSYDNGAWTNIASATFYWPSSISGAMTIPWSFRYTTNYSAWTSVKFRARGESGCYALRAKQQVFNFQPAYFDGGTISSPTSGTSAAIVQGTSPGQSRGSFCVCPEMFITSNRQIHEVRKNDAYSTIKPGEDMRFREVEAVGPYQLVPCVRIVTARGAELCLASDTPFNLKSAFEDLQEGHWKRADEMLGEEVLVESDVDLGWDVVTDVIPLGYRIVRPLSFGGASFPAGVSPHLRIYSHNMAKAYTDPGLY